VKRGEGRRREYGGERAEGGAEVMEINGNKWEVIVSLTTLLTCPEVLQPSRESHMGFKLISLQIELPLGV
jgi:hypothetical protein